MKTTFRLADFGEDENLWETSAGKPLFQEVEISWRKPAVIQRDGNIGLKREGEVYKSGYLYAILRNHGNQKTRNRIAYVGITNDLNKRFKNHPKVDDIRGLAGETSISVGEISTPGRRLSDHGKKLLREELEHILIWILYPDLWNDQKTLAVPGQGRNGGRAWDIHNSGFGFSGRMPRRIVFPWAAIIPRRNTTGK